MGNVPEQLDTVIRQQINHLERSLAACTDELHSIKDLLAIRNQPSLFDVPPVTQHSGYAKVREAILAALEAGITLPEIESQIRACTRTRVLQTNASEPADSPAQPGEHHE